MLRTWQGLSDPLGGVGRTAGMETAVDESLAQTNLCQFDPSWPSSVVNTSMWER
jgi:hypothetical protein